MKRDDFCYFFLIVLVVLVAISYHPIFMNIDSKDGDNPISPFIVLSAFVVSILAFKPYRCLKNKLLGVYILIIVVVSLLAILFDGLGYSASGLWAEARTLILSLLFIIIGFCLDLSKKQFIFICLLYSLIVAVSATAQILTNVGAFVIEELNYVTSKNSLGALAATASIVSFSLASVRRMKPLYVILFVALGFYIIVLVLTMRCRTSTVCILLFLLYYVWKLGILNPRHFFYLLLLLLLVIILARYTNLFSSAYNYFYDSFTLNHEGDISADRQRRNVEAWTIIQESPIWGRMSSNANIDWVHNYGLRVTSDYGFLGAFPLLVLYIILSLCVAFNLKTNEIRSIYGLGYVAMIVPLITSLAEPTFPFGPGTAVFFSFFLFGISLANSYKKHHSEPLLL